MSRIGGSLSNLTAIESTDLGKKNPTKTQKIFPQKPITFTMGVLFFGICYIHGSFLGKYMTLVIN